ncbi:hypothetical protein P1X16_28100 [Hymenobacter sp. YC55]|nr:hypothetical protein [Hymenobacter sp. YC55]
MKKIIHTPLALLLGTAMFLSACDNKTATPETASVAGTAISWQDASAWTATYQAAHPKGVRASFYSSNVFNTLLAQPNATGIRIYNAINADGKECLVLVGATATTDLTGEHYTAYDKGNTCGGDKNCPEDSPLSRTSAAGPTRSASVASAETAGAAISLQEAIDWTRNYQARHQGHVKASYFRTDVFKTLINLPSASGIRIYNATNTQGHDCFVLVGATENRDLTAESDPVYDKGNTCGGAENCPVDSLLVYARNPGLK